MILAKDVVMISIDGARVKIVRRNKICKALETSPGSSTSSIPNCREGRGIASAGTNPKIINIIKGRLILIIFMRLRF
jgi:hypothetical protein